MRIVRVLVVAALVAMGGAIGRAEAQEPEPPANEVWFDEDRVVLSPTEQTPQDETIARSRTAGFDATAAVSALVGDADLAAGEFGQRTVVDGTGVGATLELFDGRQLVADPLEVAVRRPLDEPGDLPWVAWLGAVHDPNGAVMAQVTMSFAPQPDGTYIASGGVTTNDGPVAITHVDGDAYRLDLTDPSTIVDEGDDVAATSGTAAVETSQVGGEIGPATHGSHPHIDVIVAFANGMNADVVRNEISDRVEHANQAMITSGDLLRINLMAVPHVNYNQTSSITADLNNLEVGFGALAGLHNLRVSMGADLVGLVVPNSTDLCGRASGIPDADGNAGIVWQVTARNPCFAGHTLTHEFGHLLGGRHNPEADPTNSPYAYSHGRTVNGTARTVMGVDNCSAGCPRTLQFSSPAVDFVGHPGVRSGVTGTRDNSLSLNQLDNYVQVYRTAATRSPIGYLDWVRREPGGLRTRGWTLDENTVNPIDMHVYVGSRGFNPAGIANVHRPDVANAHPLYGPYHGFDSKVNFQTAGTYNVCAYGINHPGTPGSNDQVGCKSLTISNTPFGYLDIVERTTAGLQVHVRGWSIDPDTAASTEIQVWIDGQYHHTVTANTSRTDVGNAHPGYGNSHGFDNTFVYPNVGTHQVCVHAINVSGTPGPNRLIGCRNIS